MQINTTLGLFDELVLQRTLGFEDRPTQYVLWVAPRGHEQGE